MEEEAFVAEMYRLQDAWTQWVISCQDLWDGLSSGDDTKIKEFFHRYPTPEQQECVGVLENTKDKGFGLDFMDAFIRKIAYSMSCENACCGIKSLLRNGLYDKDNVYEYLKDIIRDSDDDDLEQRRVSLGMLRVLVQEPCFRDICTATEGTDVLRGPLYEWVVHRECVLELFFEEGVCTPNLMEHMLHSSCMDENIPPTTVTWLLNRGASCGSVLDDSTPLQKLVAARYKEYYGGGDDRYEDARSSQVKKIRILLDTGACPKVLHHVFDPYLFPILLESGADPNQKDTDGLSIIQRYCARQYHPRTVLILLKYGADPLDALGYLIESASSPSSEEYIEETTTKWPLVTTHFLLGYGASVKDEYIHRLQLIVDRSDEFREQGVRVDVCESILTILGAHRQYCNGPPQKPLHPEMVWDDPVTYERVSIDRAWVLYDDHPSHIVNVYDEETMMQLVIVGGSISPMTRKSCSMWLPLKTLM
jgi:hypothetical protein